MMHDEIAMPGPMQLLGGYVAAVLVASTTAAAALAHEAPFVPVIMFGAIYIATAGLPGFLLTAALAHRLQWTGWLPFVVLGALNALLAWAIASTFAGLRLEHSLLVASLRGGAAGGVAYWWAAYHGLRWRMFGGGSQVG